MGLGILGRGLQVSKFLAENRALLTITDLKTENQLKTSLNKLKKLKIRYVLGKHEMPDFENADMIIKSAGVPLDSPYIKHAKEKSIHVAMDASIFVKIAKNIYPGIKIIGVTGTRGKSMTTALIYHILKQNEKSLGCKIHLGGNMRNKATLPLLKIIKPKDIVVLELDSWQLQGFGDEKISPDISVFTNLMPDHMNYYNGDIQKYLHDKENIFAFQKNTDHLVTTEKMLKIFSAKPKSKVIIARLDRKTNALRLNIFGHHNMQNIVFAEETAKICGLSDSQIAKSLKTFNGLEGRLENLGMVGKNIRVINDNNATTPEATIAGINAVRQKFSGNIVLICGGSDKGLNLRNLARHINTFCKTAILIPGSGTEKLKKMLRIRSVEENNFKKIINSAMENSKRGNIILFSPGFASFGNFLNEYDRNDKFVKTIKHYQNQKNGI